MASCQQAIAGAYYNLADYRKALEHQEKAHKILIAIMPAEDQYIRSSKMQMDQYMKLSVWAEKTKNVEKSNRPIGSNKAAASPKKVEKKMQGNRMNALYQRLQNPRQRTHLDVLEYNYLRQNQQVMAQKIMEEANKRMEEKKSEDKKEENTEDQKEEADKKAE